MEIRVKYGAAAQPRRGIKSSYHRKSVGFADFNHRKSVGFRDFNHRKSVGFACFYHRKSAILHLKSNVEVL